MPCYGGVDTLEPAVLNQVFWMHIQKTSSWLGNFLLLWGCSSVRNKQQKQHKSLSDSMLYSGIARDMSVLNCEVPFYTGDFGFGYHVPFSSQHNRTAITLFRNPYNRVISSFLFGKGIHQIMFPLGFPNRAKVKYNLRDTIRKSPFPILTYVQLPGIASCQTKMVLGKECGEVTSISEDDMAEALRRLRYDIPFVGLTEESEASARLFLAMFGFPKRDKDNKSLATVKDQEQNAKSVDFVMQSVTLAPRINKGHTSEVNAELRGVLRRHSWRDVPDETLFIEAVRIFYERCKMYQVTTKYSQAVLGAMN